ncbi:hypothetical protein ACFLUP_01305 [Chloroflexota bacterium]
MERTYIAENDAERIRLTVLASRLSDADIERTIRQGWTVGVAFVHLAFWDRLWLAKFDEFERDGNLNGANSPRDTRFDADTLNDAMLPWWQNIAPIQVKYEVIAAAEAVDRKAASLPDAFIDMILAGRPRTIIRAVHRREHLKEIERTLSGKS